VQQNKYFPDEMLLNDLNLMLYANFALFFRYPWHSLQQFSAHLQ